MYNMSKWWASHWASLKRRTRRLNENSRIKLIIIDSAVHDMPLYIFRRCLMSILADFFTPEIVQDNKYKFSQSGKYFAPPKGTYESYVEFIKVIIRFLISIIWSCLILSIPVQRCGVKKFCVLIHTVQYYHVTPVIFRSFLLIRLQKYLECMTMLIYRKNFKKQDSYSTQFCWLNHNNHLVEAERKATMLSWKLQKIF